MEDDNTQTILGFSPLAGRVISHYRLDTYLGHGGMGVVWKAEDLALKRPVAIKFLPEMSQTSPDAQARFQTEAQIAAGLDHPAICTIYEIGCHQGTWFMAMAFIDGENVSQALKTGPMDVSQALQIAIDACGGLAAAQAREIVHRDIKSRNIMITRQGRAKILDFGLARMSGSAHLTLHGHLVGTPAYMSPEQVNGKNLDHRADLWSLGVVLYEMLAGTLPFKGDYRETLLRAILETQPPPIRELRAEVPAGLERVIMKALAKEPEMRYQSASDMARDLEALRDGRALPEDAYEIAGAGPAAIRGPRAATPSIAVLPFVNLTSDPENEYFSDGLTDELIGALAQLPNLHVVSRTSAFAMKGKTADMKTVGELLKVTSVIEGSVRKSGNRARINVQLVQISDGFPVWSERYDIELKDIFEVQEQIARKTVEGLKIKLLGEGKPLFPNYRAVNIKAYNLYLQGLYHIHQLNPANFEKARVYFEECLAEDSQYAPAHAGIARYYSKLAFYNVVEPRKGLQRALAAATRALQLDNRLADTNTTLGEILLALDWDWAGAERHFLEAIRISPGDALARHPYALMLVRQGRFDEAHRQLEIALSLDPLSKALNNGLAFLFYYARDYDRAREACRKTLELDPNYFQAVACHALICLEQRQFGEAMQYLEQARKVTRDSPIALSYYAYVCACLDRAPEAREILALLLKRAETEYIAPAYIGIIYAGLGDSSHAFDWLDKACDVRDSTLTFLGIFQAFDPLRSDPRFASLLKKIGLPSNMHPERLTLAGASVGNAPSIFSETAHHAGPRGSQPGSQKV